MYRYLLIFSAVSILAQSSDPRPKYSPTKGEVWPKPQVEHKEDTYYTFYPSKFSTKITGHNCSLLTSTISRYVSVIISLNDIAKRSRRRSTGARHRKLLAPTEPTDDRYLGTLRGLNVRLNNPCESLPHAEMIENYTLSVSKKKAKLQSDSVWGIIRGLESFVQLFYLSDDYTELRINTTRITDYPRYPHRGLLLDTGRHYLPLYVILKTINAMSINKMNVFHWHITDDQSFPYQSNKFPDLSDCGAFYSTMIYTKTDIDAVIKYATERGIRVIPEFDIPGHTLSWGVAYPNLLTKCYEGTKYVGLGPINPIRNTTYKFLRDLFEEVGGLFPDRYKHIGGDEVELSCWSSNPEIKEYMQNNNVSDVNELHALFMKNTIPLLKNDSKLIVWQEVFDNGAQLSKDTLVQVWKNDWIEEMVKVLTAGNKVLFSSSYYLDILTNDVRQLYKADPRLMIRSSTPNKSWDALIVGGEACMWGEMVDEDNVLSRTWPRASAVAEVLWSTLKLNPAKNEPLFTWNAHHRMEEHACRMRRRGIPAEPPLGPGFCVV